MTAAVVPYVLPLISVLHLLRLQVRGCLCSVTQRPCANGACVNDADGMNSSSRFEGRAERDNERRKEQTENLIWQQKVLI